MDWLSIARSLAPIAPTLLGFIGGFIPIPGASIAMKMLGTAIAGTLGVPANPEAVSAAIANANELEKTKILAVLEETKAKWAAGTEQERIWAHVAEVGIAQVNETMRAEIGHEHWYFTGWRPAAGWTFILYANVYGPILMVAGVAAAFFDRPQALTTLTNAWPLYVGFFGALAAMVGVYIIGRSSEKAKAIEVGAVPLATSQTNKGGVNPIPSQVMTRPPAPAPFSRPSFSVDHQASQ